MNNNTNNSGNGNRRGWIIALAIIGGLYFIGKLTPDKGNSGLDYTVTHKGDNGFKALFDVEIPKPLLKSSLEKIGHELESKEDKPIFIRFSTVDSRIYDWGAWATYEEANNKGAEILGFTIEQMEESIPILVHRMKPNYRAAWLLNLNMLPKVYVLSGDSVTIIHKDLTYGSHKVEAVSESMFKREYETYYIESNGDMTIISNEGKKQYTCKKVQF